jgi:hypothetical protein
VTVFVLPERRSSWVKMLAWVASSSGALRVKTFGGRPMEPPVMLAVSAVASRTTRMSRWVYEVIDARAMSPNLYLMERSPSPNLSVYGSLIWVNCWSGPRVTAGRVVVKGLARML